MYFHVFEKENKVNRLTAVRLSKLEIATVQLEHSINLYLDDRDLISAITLAGAAEEILGNLVKRKGLSSSLARRVNTSRSLYRHLWKNDVAAKQFVKIKNNARNQLKHLDSGDAIDIDLCEELTKLLDRAVENFKLLSLPITTKVRAYERKRLMQWRKQQAQMAKHAAKNDGRGA